MPFGTYRKKPVEVKACRNTGDKEQLVAWCAGNGVGLGILHFHPDGRIDVATLEGTMTAEVGDWIILEPHPTDDRQLYPCKADIFDATYEAVE
jgi:hypothetical protein